MKLSRKKLTKAVVCMSFLFEKKKGVFVIKVFEEEKDCFSTLYFFSFFITLHLFFINSNIISRLPIVFIVVIWLLIIRNEV